MPDWGGALFMLATRFYQRFNRVFSLVIMQVMHIQRILGWVLLVVAVLVCFAQTCSVLTMTANPPPTLRGFAYSYTIRSSIECYGFAVAATIVGFFVLRSRERFWPWAALAVTIVGLWFFVGRELWAHYIELPRIRRDFLATHSYFNFSHASMWSCLPRLAWHILLPFAVVLSTLVVRRCAGGESR